LEEKIDSLAVPITRIFLSIILSREDWCQKYFIDTIEIAKWRTLYTVGWVVWKSEIDRVWNLNSNMDNDWNGLTQALEDLERQYFNDDHKFRFLLSDNLTAADIALASHVGLILFPNVSENKSDGWANKCSYKCPPLHELKKEDRVRIEKIRSSKIGQWVMTLYRKERGKSFGRKLSIHDKSSNPWWSNQTYLSLTIYSTLSTLIIVCWTILILAPWWISLLSYFITLGLCLWFFVRPLKKSEFGQWLRQLWFLRFGKDRRKNTNAVSIPSKDEAKSKTK